MIYVPKIHLPLTDVFYNTFTTFRMISSSHKEKTTINYQYKEETIMNMLSENELYKVNGGQEVVNPPKEFEEINTSEQSESFLCTATANDIKIVPKITQ